MEFLKSITPKEAGEVLETFRTVPETETVDIEEALHRILSQDMVSPESIPSFSRSLVDGYALHAKDTYGGKETTPSFVSLKGEVGVGEEARLIVGDGESAYVSTGAMIPPGADAAVMDEHVRRLPDAIEVTRSVHKGENIIFQGEDIREGDVVLVRGKRLSPFDLGVLAALGFTNVPVYRRLVAGIISSGDEITPIVEKPPAGKVRDINRYTVSNLLRREDVTLRFLGIAADTIEEITEKLNLARECSLILVSGGSSKGERDFITASIERLGGKIMFHGINIRPGKPTIFATLRGKPVFGLPGHPASCAMVVVRFVLPFVRMLKGERDPMDERISGELTANVPSTLGMEEYMRVMVEDKAGTYLITPLFAKSSVISSLARSVGYVVIPEGREGYEKGERVEVFLFS
jgi:molybdopterin molybdotransferase